MKVITVTRSARPSTTALVSETPRLHKVSESSVTIVVSYLLETKDMFLTFSEQELRDMLSHIADKVKEQDNFMDTLKGKSTPSTPNDSGSLV